MFFLCTDQGGHEVLVQLFDIAAQLLAQMVRRGGRWTHSFASSHGKFWISFSAVGQVVCLSPYRRIPASAARTPPFSEGWKW